MENYWLLFGSAVTLVTSLGMSWYWKSYITPVRRMRAQQQLCIAGQHGDLKKAQGILQLWDLDTTEALYYGCRYGNVELCLYLCGKNRAKLNVSLEVACKHNKKELVEKLLEAGADGVSEALLTACEYGQIDVLEPLVKAGANPIKGMRVTTNSAVLNKLSVLRSEYSISLLNDGMLVEKVMKVK